VPPPNLVLLPRRRIHRHLLAVASGAGPSHGMDGQPPGRSIAARRRAPYPGADRAGVSKAWSAGGPRRGAERRPPAPCSHHIPSFGARTRKLLISYSRASILAAVGRMPWNLQQERHTSRGWTPAFRADLLAYLDSLPVGELAELLGELPSRRQPPLQLGVLMVALNERLPDAYKLLPPAGQPARARGGAARCARWSPTAAPPAPAVTLTRRRRGWPSGSPTASGRPTSTLTGAQAGAVAERRVAQALRARATDPNPAAGRQEHDDPPPQPADPECNRQDQKRDRGPEDDFDDSWRTYRERADHIARPTAGGCRSRRRAPPTGCRSAATATRSTTSYATVRTAGSVKSVTMTARTADLECSTPANKPQPRCRGLSLAGGR